MIAAPRLRTVAAASVRTLPSRPLALSVQRRLFASGKNTAEPPTNKATDEITVAASRDVTEGPAPVPTPLKQAPNRTEIWSRSQRPRSEAMTGPRFEQTDFALQPQAYAAIELIHKQPVRWTHERVVACDGGGGATGHPKIFINTDKPEIAVCNYCGLPFANEHHRKHLESLPQTSYPLS
ncbi:hypothetical protein VTK73DRAFT_3765 [Phialemonium thermophilum]|uniref:Zinc finger CHCC-type domain-containing protein n=1 Tax=Phialemonium thermophilum TaxID=223376 RepID=A0ABR3WXC4_9PEZI